MAVKWHCDGCGKPGHIHPPTEPLFEEHETEMDLQKIVGEEERAVEYHETYMDTVDVTGADGKVTKQQVAKTRLAKKVIKVPLVKTVKEKVKHKVAKIVRMKRQNIHTGHIEHFEVHEHRDLEPRSFVVTLAFGGEEITRHLCRGCLNNLMPALRPAWDALEATH